MDTEKSMHTISEKISPRNVDSLANDVVGNGQRNVKSDGSLKTTEGKSKSQAGKLASVVAEKIWDGSLRLNSSVTVSAVAFFKSGERMHDLKWSKFIEVKGKVRLEAFEKYIQDLPRSRNRRLMVISLSCKEGSSKSGLAGMKEVAKGYKKGERVGLAQLSQGIDLYICPRSNTIITILAKHGFFKGKAAVEVNQDSLIGCVVWRRNRASSNSVTKKSEGNNHSLFEQPVNSPSDSYRQRVDEKDMSRSRAGEQSIQVTSRMGCVARDGSGNNFEYKNNKHNQPELHTSSTNADLLLKSFALNNSPSMSKGPQTSSVSDSASLSAPVGQLLQIESPLTSCLQEKPKPALEVLGPVLPMLTCIVKEILPMPDDDDLPEFDFGSACYTSQVATSQLLDALIAEEKLPAVEFKKTNGFLPPKMSTAQSRPTPNQRELGTFSIPRLPLDTIQRMSLQKEACEDDETSSLANLEEKCTARSWLPISSTAVSLPKNCFDEDDDMPEWCPPNIKMLKQPTSETIRPAITSIFSKVSTSTSELFGPDPPPSHLLPSASSGAHEPFSTNAFGRAFHCPVSHHPKPPQQRLFNEYLMQGPNSLMRFNSDTRQPNHPAGWSGWR